MGCGTSRQGPTNSHLVADPELGEKAKVTKFRMAANAHNIEKSVTLLDHHDRKNRQSEKAAAVQEHAVLKQNYQKGKITALVEAHEARNQKNQQKMKAPAVLGQDAFYHNNKQNINADARLRHDEFNQQNMNAGPMREHDVRNRNVQQNIKAETVLKQGVFNQNNEQNMTAETVVEQGVFNQNNEQNMTAEAAVEQGVFNQNNDQKVKAEAVLKQGVFNQSNDQKTKAETVLKQDILNHKNQQNMKAAAALELHLLNQNTQQDIKAAIVLAHDVVPNQSSQKSKKTTTVREHKKVPNQNKWQRIRAATMREHDGENQNSAQDMIDATLHTHDVLLPNKKQGIKAAALVTQPCNALSTPHHQKNRVAYARDHQRALSPKASSNSSLDLEWASRSTFDVTNDEGVDTAHTSAWVCDRQNIEQAVKIRSISWLPPSTTVNELRDAQFATLPPLIAKGKKRRKSSRNSRISARPLVARATPSRYRARKLRSHKRHHRHTRANVFHRSKKIAAKRGTEKRAVRTKQIRFGPDTVVRRAIAAVRSMRSGSRRTHDLHKSAMKKRTYRSEQDVVFGQETKQEWDRERDLEPDPSSWFPERETSLSNDSATTSSSPKMFLFRQNVSTSSIWKANHDLSYQQVTQSCNPQNSDVPSASSTATDSKNKGPASIDHATTANTAKVLTTSSLNQLQNVKPPSSAITRLMREISKSHLHKKSSAIGTNKSARFANDRSTINIVDSALPEIVTDKHVRTTTSITTVVAAARRRESSHDWPPTDQPSPHKNDETRCVFDSARTARRGYTTRKKQRASSTHNLKHEPPRSSLNRKNAPTTQPASETVVQRENRSAEKDASFRSTKVHSKRIVPHFVPAQRIQSSKPLKTPEHRVPKPQHRNSAPPEMVIHSAHNSAPTLCNPQNPSRVVRSTARAPCSVALTKRASSTPDAMSIQQSWGKNDSPAPAISAPTGSHELKLVLTRHSARHPHERQFDTTWYATRRSLKHSGHEDVKGNYTALHVGERGQMLTESRQLANNFRSSPEQIVSTAAMKAMRWLKNEGAQEEKSAWNHAGVKQRWSKEQSASPKTEIRRVIKSLRPSVQKLSI